MSTTRGLTLGLTLATALLTVACARTMASPGANAATAPSGAATVVVQNNNFSDVDVFTVQDGTVTTRLGMVTGGSTATFAVDPSFFPTGQLGLIATPIGGSGVARSGPVLVNSGKTVTFMIQPDLRSSMATVQ
jgi:hypothetical protein